MQEKSLYAAVLAELSDEELVGVVGAELHRRKNPAIIAVFADEGYSAAAFPLSWEGFEFLPLAHQLRVYSAQAVLYESEKRTVEGAD